MTKQKYKEVRKNRTLKATDFEWKLIKEYATDIKRICVEKVFKTTT